MTRRKPPTLEKSNGVDVSPEVIVDFECKNDLLYIVIANVGSSSAHRISIDCDEEITDFRSKRLSHLDAFRHLEFLAPGKRMVLFVDNFSSYIRRRQPLRVAFSVKYFDRNHHPRSESIRHNLAIFKDVVVPDESGTAQ